MPEGVALMIFEIMCLGQFLGGYKYSGGHNSPGIPLHVLWEGHRLSFFPGLPFWGCLYSSHPWLVNIVSPNRAKGGSALLVALEKDLSFLSLRFLTVTQTHSVCSIHLVSPPGLCGISGTKSWSGCDALAACCAVNHEILCLWPRGLMSSVSIHETAKLTC